MLVSIYLDDVIKSRPYKYSTKQSLIRDVNRLGIMDLDTSEITSALIRDKVDCIPNHNSRRRLYITAQSIFKELGFEFEIWQSHHPSILTLIMENLITRFYSIPK